LILATTGRKSIPQQMGMSNCFDSEIKVPNITTLASIGCVLKELSLFNDVERKQALKKKNFNIDIGIKKLLKISDRSRQDVDKVRKFVNTIMEIQEMDQKLN
jgi:hypothetical protein